MHKYGDYDNVWTTPARLNLTLSPDNLDKGDSKIADKAHIWYNLNELVLFNGHNKKHFRLTLLENGFSKCKTFSLHQSILQNGLAGPAMTPARCSFFFENVQKLINSCLLEELENAMGVIATQLLSKSGVIEIKGLEFRLSGTVPLKYSNALFNGKGRDSFGLRVYFLVFKRVNSIRETAKIIDNLSDRESKLKMFLDKKESSQLMDRPDLHSELVLTGGWHILRDLKKVFDLNMGHHEDERLRSMQNKSRDVMVKSLIELGGNLSEHMVLVIKSKYISSLSEQHKEKINKMLRLFGKIFRSKIILVNRIMDQELISSDEEVAQIAENVKMTIMYAIQSLPQEDVFKSKMSASVFEQFQLFYTFVNYFYDVSPKNFKQHFSDSISLKLHFLPDLKGQSLQKIISTLTEITNSPKFTPKISQKFYDNLMLDIETWLCAREYNCPDWHLVVAMKSWVLLSQLKNKVTWILANYQSMAEKLVSYCGRDRSSYLPRELFAIMMEICFLFSKLLQSNNGLMSILRKNGGEKVFFRSKDLRIQQLDVFASSIHSQRPKDFMCYTESIQSIYDSFITLCQGSLRSQKDTSSLAIEEKVIGFLAEKKHSCTVLEALADPVISAELHDQPWLKNQSWNRTKLTQLSELCRLLTFSHCR